MRFILAAQRLVVNIYWGSRISRSRTSKALCFYSNCRHWLRPACRSGRLSFAPLSQKCGVSFRPLGRHTIVLNTDRQLQSSHLPAVRL